MLPTEQSRRILVFDDHRLVANALLLAQHLGLRDRPVT